MASPVIQQHTWDDWFKIAIRNNFQGQQRLRQEIKILQDKSGGRPPPASDLKPFSAMIQNQRPVLILQGTVLKAGVAKAGSPAVIVCVTITDQYPGAFPIITMEAPDPNSGWAFRQNMRNIGADGTCYLASITNWRPNNSMLREPVEELAGIVLSDYPFEQRGMPQAAPSAPPPPQQQQPVPVQSQARPIPQQQPQGPPPPGAASNPAPNQYNHQQPQQQQPQYHHQQGPPPPAGGGGGGVYHQAPGHAMPPPQPHQQQHQQQQQGQGQQARRYTPPPQADSVTVAWTTITGVVFELGEAELSKNGGGRFMTQADQWRCIDRWCHQACKAMVHRRIGNPDGIELVTGNIMKEEHVRNNQQLLNLYHLIINAQVSGGGDAEVQRVVAGMMELPGFKPKMQESANLLAEMYAPGAEKPPNTNSRSAGPLTMDQVWTSFFASLFKVGEESLQRGDLTGADVSNQEPWLYIGLTSATALETILRSPPQGPMVLALGEKSVTPDMVPPDGQELFGAFLQLRDLIASTGLTGDEVALLKRKALWSDRDDRKLDVPPKLARIVGGLSSIAARASQHQQFKLNFHNTLNLLAAIA